jgi:hypothetical protein
VLANIHLNDGIDLDPDLAVVVEKLALKHPSWVFRSNATPDSNPSEYGSKHLSRWYDNRVNASVLLSTDGKKYVRTVAVLQDGLSAGRITVDRDYNRRASQNWQYEIVSPRIANGRKGEKLTTRDAGVAVRTASKHFMAPSLSEMLSKAVAEARSNLESTLRDLERPIERGQFCPDVTTMQITLYNLLKGVPFDERNIREKLLSDKYEAALADFELGRHMRVLMPSMRGLIAFRGQYVFTRDGDPTPYYQREVETAAVSTAPFEELPTAWQEKIAVLQLMRDSELVLDVGYRQNESTFLIVA